MSSNLAYSRHIQLSDSDLEEDPSESWHVLVGGEDVKVLSTDQLADLYRLSIVDEGTLLWQPGMGQWRSLAQVAGLEGEPPAAPSYAPQATVSYAAAAARAPAPELSVPSAPPLALTISPPPGARGRERWLLGGALVVGMLVSLYRTDALYALAESWHQGAAFAAAEQRVLGGPGAQTPRGLRSFLAAHSPSEAPPSLPREWGGAAALAAPEKAAVGAELDPSPSAVSSSVSPERKASGTDESDGTVRAAGSSARAGDAASGPAAETAESAAPSSAPVPLDDAELRRKMEQTLAPSRAAAPATTATARSAVPARRRPRQTSGADAVIPGMKPGGNEYDPLNSKL